MVDVPVVTPGPDVGATVTPQPSAAPASTPAAQPTEPAKQVETSDEGLAWIDDLGVTPPGPPAPAPAPGAAYYGPPPGYRPAYTPPPAAPAQPAPGDLINAFVKDPRGFVASVAKEMAAEQVTPFIEALKEYVDVTHKERVFGAVQESRGRLREYARTDPSLQDPRVAQEVNNTYAYFINNAARGNPEAIAALNNPATPFLVTQAAKLRSGKLPSPNAPGGPVVYSGGSLEGRSTVTSRPAPPVESTSVEFGRLWGLSDDQIARNDAEAQKYLNQK